MIPGYLAVTLCAMNIKPVMSTDRVDMEVV